MLLYNWIIIVKVTKCEYQNHKLEPVRPHQTEWNHKSRLWISAIAAAVTSYIGYVIYNCVSCCCHQQLIPMCTHGRRLDFVQRFSRFFVWVNMITDVNIQQIHLQSIQWRPHDNISLQWKTTYYNMNIYWCITQWLPTFGHQVKDFVLDFEEVFWQLHSHNILFF